MAHVLAVEDSPTQAARLCADLESAGFEVTLAADAEDALQRMEAFEFDVVVSDVVMPGLSGYELCRKIKDDPRRGETPVVLLTSLADPLEVVNGLESGADNFIRKPYEVDQLVSRLRAAIANRQLRADGRFELGVHLLFLDREFEITAGKQQILDLLISTFEELVVTSREVRRHESELVAAHAELEEQLQLVDLERKRLQAVVDAVPVPLFVTDSAGVVTHASRATAIAIDTDAATARGNRLDQIVSFVDADQVKLDRATLPHQRALGDGVPATQGESFDLFLSQPDGGRIPVVLDASPILDDLLQPAGCVTTVRTLGGLTEYDPLTGLPNAASFLDRAAGVVGGRHRLSAVLVIELDHFDLVHASLATADRNALVVEASRALRHVFDAEAEHGLVSPPMLAHLGAQRFAVLLTDLSDSFRPVHLAETARRAVAAISLGDGGRTLTASVGVAVDEGDRQSTELFAAAIEALGHAIGGGGNRVETLGAAAAATAMERLQLETDLREAVERDEITLHYQPEFDLTSGELTGFEALARWRRRDHGPVPPPVFIGVAEQSGLIPVLGRQLLRRACKEATSWDGLGGHGVLTVAVNVSTIQLRPEFVDDVTSVLKETGLEPSRLMLEVTETAAMSDPETKVPVIEKLKQTGVRFALDDFGTGYSSLTQLTHARFDQLKLDRSFVDAIDRPGTDAVVARSIVSLARALDIPVVAEGVETQAQLDCLRELECNLCQGYLVGKPIPGELVHDFLHGDGSRPSLLREVR